MSVDVQAIRSQFPSLNQPTADGTIPIFFDNPAGTQVPQQVIDAVVEYYRTMNANSGGTFATSQKTDQMMATARQKVANFLNANDPSEIVFGPSMTALTFNLTRSLGKTLNAGDEIVLTRMDHDGNVAPWLRIAEDHDLVIRWVDIIEPECTLNLDTLEAALTDKTKVVATVHASNAVGTINPVQQIADMAHAAGALYFVDAVQSAPHVSIDVQAIGCDFLACSAYKFFGPHIGVLWGKYDLLQELPAYKVRPAKDKPPYRWENGTPSFETIHGVAAAIDYLAAIGEQYGNGNITNQRQALEQAMSVLQDYEQELVARLIAGLQKLPSVTIAGITDPAKFKYRVPTVVMVMEGYTPEQVARHLAENHIYVWHGDYYAVEIIERLGHAEHGMVRIGLAHYNTAEEVDRLLEVLAQLT